MGLFQRAIETYESHLLYAENQSGITPMAPIGHLITGADIEITLDSDGIFVIAAAVDSNEAKTIIPVTESSAGRTSAPCAHPLCEQIGYLVPQNEVKYKLYVDQLTAWASSEFSHPKLAPILNYVKSGSVADDLEKCGLIKLNSEHMMAMRIASPMPFVCSRYSVNVPCMLPES